MSSRCQSAAVLGIEARLVEVEVEISQKSPQVVIVGLPDAAVRESRDRVRSAIESSGYDFPIKRKVVVNLAPASVRKVGPVYDLPIALAVLAATGVVPRPRLRGFVVMGELALDGRVRRVRGALPVALSLSGGGRRWLMLPAGNAREAALCPDVLVLPVRTLTEAVRHFSGDQEIVPVSVRPESLLAASGPSREDLRDVRGQDYAKRALTIAAAGSHNLLLVGPPGAGKTMLARRLPTILPPLSLSEALETTAVHSVAGELGDRVVVAERPFRAPHHSISTAGLLGGGPQGRPGEACLAHRGVLFLDELPEFDRRTVDALRQPLEEGELRIARVAYSVKYPARFVFVAAMNPCRCGKYGLPDGSCTCTPQEVASYRSRISGPLLDRIDLRVEVPPVRFEELSARAGGETSADVRAKVMNARALQVERQDGRTNAALGAAELRSLVRPDRAGRELLKTAMDRLGLTARGHDRVLRVARTIADLKGTRSVPSAAIAEALQFRG